LVASTLSTSGPTTMVVAVSSRSQSAMFNPQK
jgi:hypothetical protein